jgi:ABC-type sulfate transport system permease subunit
MAQEISTRRRRSGSTTDVFKRIGGRTLSVYAILFYLFLYAPIIILIIFSFNASRFVSEWAGFTLDWYASLFNDHAIGAALRNSLIVAITATLISTIIGTMVSIGIERYNFKGKLALDAMLFLPIIIPDIAMAIMLLAFFVLIGRPLVMLGLIQSFKFGFPTIIISHCAFNISFVAVVVRARMASLDPQLEEAAADLADHLPAAAPRHPGRGADGFHPFPGRLRDHVLYDRPRFDDTSPTDLCADQNRHHPGGECAVQPDAAGFLDSGCDLIAPTTE